MHKFSRVLIFAGINSRNRPQIRKNSRKLMPAKYAKTADSRKFAKINPRENMKLSTFKTEFQQNAEKNEENLAKKGLNDTYIVKLHLKKFFDAI